MCVIIAKSAGLRWPSTKTLAQCWAANPDGAGLMLLSGGQVQIHKGFMDLPSLKAALKKVRPAQSAVLHFRHATSGSRSAAMTHPFPISADPDDLQSMNWSGDAGVAHNGIFGSGEGSLSDTAVFVRDVLTPLRDRLTHSAVLQLLSMAIDTSSLALLTADIDDPLLLGSSWINQRGIWYSNLDWRSRDWHPMEWRQTVGYCPNCHTEITEDDLWLVE